MTNPAHFESFRPPEEELGFAKDDLVEVTFVPLRGRIDGFKYEGGQRIAIIKCSEAPGGIMTARLDQIRKVKD